MPRSLDLLFFLSLLLQATSFHLADHGNSINETKSTGNYEKPIKNHRNILNVEVSGRNNEEVNEAGLSDAAENTYTYIHCVITLDGNNQPQYFCKHSDNIKMMWHGQNEKLTGIFSISPNCPTQASYDNEMQRRMISRVRESKLLPRDKRRTIYRDDAGEAESPPEAEQTEEATEEEDQDDNEGSPAVLADETVSEEATEEEPDVADVPVSVVEDSQQDAQDDEEKKDIAEKEESTTSEKDEIRTENGEVEEYDDYDDPIVGVGIGIEVIIPTDKIWSYVEKLGELISGAGDYILSLLLGKFKHGFHHSRIDERFNEKVRKIANSTDGNRNRAMKLLTRQIRKQLGESYQIELVKFLKKLADNYKP